MNAQQREKIIESIRADVQLQCSYFEPSEPGKYCVIGGLVASAGGDPEKMFEDVEQKRITSSFNLDSEQREKLDNAREFLFQKFGLDSSQLRDLQCINDYADDLEERRAKLIEYVNSLPLEETA